MKHRAAIFWGIVGVSILAGLIAYDSVPDVVDSHWNAAGEPDSTMPKFWGIFLVPMVLAALTGVALAIPRIDPLKANIALFRKYYDGFMMIVMLFMLAVHGFLILWNLGIRIPPTAIFVPAVAVLFYAIGVLCGAAKRNWFVGIRTPWTLTSDTVWDRTHRRATPLFKIAAVIVLAGVFLGEYAIHLFLAVTIGLVFYLVWYSYLEYRREQKSG